MVLQHLLGAGLPQNASAFFSSPCLSQTLDSSAVYVIRPSEQCLPILFLVFLLMNFPLVVNQSMVLTYVISVPFFILCNNEINIEISFYRTGFGVCSSYRAVFLFMSHPYRETPRNRRIGPSTERTVGYKKLAGL